MERGGLITEKYVAQLKLYLLTYRNRPTGTWLVRPLLLGTRLIHGRGAVTQAPACNGLGGDSGRSLASDHPAPFMVQGWTQSVSSPFDQWARKRPVASGAAPTRLLP